MTVYQEYGCSQCVNYCRIDIEVVAELAFLCINRIYTIVQSICPIQVECVISQSLDLAFQTDPGTVVFACK